MVLSTDNCGRRGCHKMVANGMACERCCLWFHPNCTGLNSDQYEKMSNSGSKYVCVACIFQDTRLIDLLQASETCEAPQVAPKLQSTALDSTEEKLEKLQNSISQAHINLNAKMEHLLAELTGMRSALPSEMAAEKALRLSEQAIIDASIMLKDKAVREKQLIIWGKLTSSAPTETAQNILGAVLPDLPMSDVSAQRLHSKGKKS